jgi:hypothetical protein
MTGGARRGGEREVGGGRGARLGRSWAQSGGARGKGGGGKVGWAGRLAGPRARGRLGQKGEGEGGERRKDFPFLISIFYMNAFTLSNNQRNAWFGMVQQSKENNSRIYYCHMT